MAHVSRGSSPRSDSLVGLDCWQEQYVRVHSRGRCQSRGSAHISCQDREKVKDEGYKIPFKATLLIVWRLNTRLCHLRIQVISQYPFLGPSLYILAFKGKSSKTSKHTGAIILVNCFSIFIHTDMRALNEHHRASS